MVWPIKGPQGPQVPCALRAGRQQLSAVRHAAIALRCQSPRDQRLRVCSKMGMVWPRKMEKFKGMMSWGIDTSRTRARRVAEVSRFKDCDATGSKDKVCLQEMQRTLTVSQLCSVNSSSFCLTPFHMWPPLFQLFSYHLCSSQFSKLFSTTLFFFSALPASAQLFSPLPRSSQRLSPLPTSSQLFSPLATSSQLVPPLLTPAQFISTLLTSCQLFSALASSSQLSSPLFTEMLYTGKFVHTGASTHRFFSQTSCFTDFFFTANSYTEKLLHTANFYTQQTFTHSKLLHRETATQDAPKWKNLLPKHRSQPSCSYYNTVYDSQLQNKIVFHMQLQQRGTMPQPFHCDLQTLSCKEIFAPRLRKWQLQTVSRRPNGKNTILKHFLKGFILSTEYHHRQNGETSA